MPSSKISSIFSVQTVVSAVLYFVNRCSPRIKSFGTPPDRPEGADGPGRKTVPEKKNPPCGAEEKKGRVLCVGREGFVSV